MRKQIIVSLLAEAFIFLVLLAKSQTVYAGACSPTSAGQCTDWQCSYYSCTVDGPYGPIAGWCSICTCASDPTVCNQCNPGQYSCNNASGCCDIATPPPTNPPGNPGGTPTPPSCTLPSGAPSGLTVSGNLTCSGNNPVPVTLKWNAVTGATGYTLSIDNTSNGFVACGSGTPNAGDACIVLPSTTITTVNLTPNANYKWWVQPFNACGTGTTSSSFPFTTCSSGTPPPATPTPPGSTPGPPTAPPAQCTVALTPSTVNVPQGNPSGVVLTANTSCNVPIDQVVFSSSNTGIITVTPGSDTTSLYQTTAVGVTPGSAVITATVYAGGVPLASDTSVINSIPPNPWWQVKDADVGTSGDLKSAIATGQVFDLPGPGTFPGVPMYGDGQNLTGITSVNVSATHWLVQSTPTSPRVYDYQSLVSQIPADTIINTINTPSVTNANFNASNSSYGYTWYKYSGNGGAALTISGALNIGSKKVVLLVDSADLQINAPITVTDGFFMVLVGETAGGAKGNIVVGPGVGGSGPNLEGIYEADNTFSDGGGATQLWVRGSVVAYGGVSLLRDLSGSNLTTPADLFEYAPDQVVQYPAKLGARKINWKEVAP